MYQALTLAKKIAQELYFHKGENIVVYDVKNMTPFASYCILVSADNAHKLNGLKEYVKDIIEKGHAEISHIEGNQTSSWILIDAYDILINLFSEDERKRLCYDEIYKKCPQIDYLKKKKE